MKRAALFVLAAAAALLPAVAQADYLYNAMPPERMPYVMVIMDNSYTMSYTDGGQYGLNPDLTPRTRLDSAKRVFTNLLPELEGIGIGFVHFYENNKKIDLNGNGSTSYLVDIVNGPLNADASEEGRACGACLITYPDGVTDRPAILAEMALMSPVADTPLATSVSFAGRMIKRVLRSYTPGVDVDGGPAPRQSDNVTETADDNRDLIAIADPQGKCREYYVILMTDGQDSCTPGTAACFAAWVAAGGITVPGQVPACALAAGRQATGDAIHALLDLDIGAPGLAKKRVRTIVIGFVPAADPALINDLNFFARRGHMQYVAATDSFPAQNDAPGAPDQAVGTALFASNEAELQIAFRKAFEAAMQGEFTGAAGIVSTVPQVKTEIDRVSRNFLVYGGFRQPGSKGRLYGIKLYEENPAALGSGDWRYSDLRPAAVGGPLNLDTCGAAGNPCAFEAGGMLTARVAGGTSDRYLFTARKLSEIAAAGGIGNTLELNPVPLTISTGAGGGGLQTAWADYLTNTASGATNLAMLNANVTTELAGGLTSNGIAALGAINASDLQHVAEWLHGLPKAPPARPFGRKWALGDIVHSSVAIVEPPGRQLQSGYPAFRNYLRKRPTMVYVGANDGMIHAFQANDDVISLATLPVPLPMGYTKGTEKWAYLPPSQLGNAAASILSGKDRFFSQDLSCRVDDVLVEPGVGPMVCDAANDCTCTGDSVNTHYCGWRTVLVCGQGWGGSWYTALDVSNPSAPRPMWEFTDFPTAGADGIGRTWSVPGVGVVNIDGIGLKWVAVFGNGYNSNNAPCTATAGNNKKCDGPYTFNPANQALNFPYTGRFPSHGDGTQDDTGRVWAIDMANGQPFGRYDVDASTVVADVPVLDVNNDALADVAYPSTWGGEASGKNYVTRLFLPHTNAAGTVPLVTDTETRVNAWGICPANGLVMFGDHKPITVRPAVFAHPYKLNEVFLFAGSGVEKNSGVKHPDEQNNSGNAWDFAGVTFPDFGSSECSPTVKDLCKTSGKELLDLGNNGAARERLLGSPVITRQATGKDLLYFVTYVPAAAFCENGEGLLHCVDITDPQSCLVCGDLNGDGTVDADDEYVSLNDPTATAPASPPPPPSMDSGGAVVIGSNGPSRPGETLTDTNGDGLVDGGPGCTTCGCPGHPPCEEMPRTVPAGWREIF